MRSWRWGLTVVSLVGGAFILSGCCQVYKERILNLERLNKDQGAIITQLTMDKEMYARENDRLKSELVTAKNLSESQRLLLEKLQQAVPAATTETTPPMAGGDEMVRNQYGVGVRLSSDLLFDAGSATLKATGDSKVKALAAQIKETKNKVAVWGFTDSDPIKHSGWKSNFDLSGARALAVLEVLRKNGVHAERLHFAGFGEYALIYDNGKENKARSRRVEIILLDSDPTAAEVVTPVKGPAPKTPPKAPVLK